MTCQFTHRSVIPEMLYCRFKETEGVHLSSKAPDCPQSQVQGPWNSSKAIRDPSSSQAPTSPASPGPALPLQSSFPMILSGSCLCTSVLAVPPPGVLSSSPLSSPNGSSKDATPGRCLSNLMLWEKPMVLAPHVLHLPFVWENFLAKG